MKEAECEVKSEVATEDGQEASRRRPEEVRLVHKTECRNLLAQVGGFCRAVADSRRPRIRQKGPSIGGPGERVFAWDKRCVTTLRRRMDQDRGRMRMWSKWEMFRVIRTRGKREVRLYPGERNE